jgi:quinol monooxygenase YgiN
VPYVVNAHWTSTPGNEDVVLDAIKKLTGPSRAEPGCRLYQAYQDPAEPLVIHIFEIYDDEEALKAHSESEHFARFAKEQAIPLLAARGREYYWTIDT